MAHSRKRKSSSFYPVFGVLMALVILGLSAYFLASPRRDYSPVEKRTLSSFPTLNLTTLADGSFMNQVETWMSDQFPLRDRFVVIKTRVDLLRGQRESQNVYCLTDGSLAERFTDPEPEKEARILAAIDAFAARYPAADFSFLLVPSAVSVKAALLPEHALTDDQNAFIDRFNAALPERFTRIDLREAFAAAPDGARLFYRTDHHWAEDGVAIAANALHETLGVGSLADFDQGVAAGDFVGALSAKSGFPADQADRVVIYRPKEGTEAAGILYTVDYEAEQTSSASIYRAEALRGDNAYEVFLGGNHPSITIRTSCDTDRSLLILRDSFANACVPLLVPYFKTITLIDPRYYYGDIDLAMQTEGYTDVLFLYCASTFSEGSSLATVLENGK